MTNLDLIVAPCVLWPMIAYANTIGNDDYIISLISVSML
jgi:hypothetical protein